MKGIDKLRSPKNRTPARLRDGPEIRTMKHDKNILIFYHEP